MRKRQAILLAANGRWPDAGGGFGVRFNWVKVDNRGTNPVDVALSGTPASGDKIDTLMTVAGGRCRVFNVAGPKDPDGSRTEDWPDQINLVSASGTNVILEVADYPIFDLGWST